VQITRLRRKIEPDPRQPRYLQTVRGAGYRLSPDWGGHSSPPVGQASACPPPPAPGRRWPRSRGGSQPIRSPRGAWTFRSGAVRGRHPIGARTEGAASPTPPGGNPGTRSRCPRKV